MKKLIGDVIRDPKYFADKILGKKRISAADHSYFTNNGRAVKALYKVIELFGNRYSGK